MRGAVTLAVLLLAALDASAASTAAAEAAKIESRTLANGLEIVVWPDHDIPNVAMFLWYRVGTRNERPGITGISHFFEHMMFNGTKTRRPGDFDRIMESNGGRNNAYTSSDVTVYQNWFPRSALEVVFDLEADRMRNLDFDPKAVESERGVVYSERRSSVDNDNFGVLAEQMQGTAFIAHPYQFPTVGWPSDIEGWTIYANKTRGDCLIVHDYGPDAVGAVQMGVTQNDKEVGYLGVFTKADIGIQGGNQSPIFVSIGGKLYGGVVTSTKAEAGYSGGYILTEDPDAVRRGADNLRQHLAIIAAYGIPAVVALNEFPTDHASEFEALRDVALEAGARDVIAARHFAEGGAGAEDLARAVWTVAQEGAPDFRFLSREGASQREQIEDIATRIYGADGVDYLPQARKDIARMEDLGFGQVPVCMAKTHLSLSHDPLMLNRPSDFRLPVRGVVPSAGAGFVVALCGDMQRMPGYGRTPAFHDIDIDEQGRTVGLF